MNNSVGMRDKIGFVCDGQAAGNIGDLLAANGYTVFAINTAEEDIKTLKHVKNTFHIPGGKGCNKNRNLAKHLLIDHSDEILNQISDVMVDCDIVYCIFSTGGGSGSGFSPWLIDILINDVFVAPSEDNPDEMICTKSVGAIPILADYATDSPQARNNTLECINELREIEFLKNIFIIDNSKMKSKMSINQVFVEDLVRMLEIPDKHSSAKGIVDKSELEKCMATPGISLITSFEGVSCKVDDVVEAIKRGIYANPDVIDGEEAGAFTYLVSSTVKDVDYQGIREKFGVFRDEYHTFNQDYNILMFVGLPFPEHRLESLEKYVADEAEKLERTSRQQQQPARKYNVKQVFNDTTSGTVIRRERMKVEQSQKGSLDGLKTTKAKSKKEQLMARLMK